MANCEFYELDAALKAEDEALTAAYGTAPEISEQERPDRPEILDLCCGGFCKWMSICEGYPGEEAYCCTNPKCQRIVHVEIEPPEDTLRRFV